MQTPVPSSASPSGKTAQDMIDDIRAILNEATASFFQDDQILEWYNSAITDAVARTWCISEEENIVLVDSTVEYELTNDVLVIADVIYKDRKGLIPGHPRQLGHLPDPLEPTHFYFLKSKVGIMPKPTNLIVDDTCLVIEIPLMTAIALSGAIPTPSYLDDSLDLYVLSKAFMRDDKPNLSLATREDYKESVMHFRSDLLTNRGQLQDVEKKE